VRVKIREGTVTDDATPLCPTCRYATIVRGSRLNDEIVECSQLMGRAARINFAVVRCSSYSDRRRPSIREMEEIAWILRSDERRKTVGFVRARDLRPSARFLLDDDEW
jgi:hypothetical protein